MRQGAKCEAYGQPCKEPATKLVEVWDERKGWVTMIFCDRCCQELLRDSQREIANGELVVRF